MKALIPWTSALIHDIHEHNLNTLLNIKQC